MLHALCTQLADGVVPCIIASDEAGLVGILFKDRFGVLIVRIGKDFLVGCGFLRAERLGDLLLLIIGKLIGVVAERCVQHGSDANDGEFLATNRIKRCSRIVLYLIHGAGSICGARYQVEVHIYVNVVECSGIRLTGKQVHRRALMGIAEHYLAEERAAAHGGQIKCALEGQRLYLLIVQPPVGMAAKETIMPTASMGDIFPAILTLLGGTVGGYITFAGAHRLIDSGITGKENLKEINKSSVMGMGIATIVRIFLFLAVLGVVVATATSPAHTLDAANPTADAFLQGAGQIGYRFFGLVILCAAVTSIVGCAYTSVSFLKTFSKTIEKNEKWFIVGFIAISTVCMALAGQPAVLLVLAGALNGLILPITLGVCLIASQKKSVMGEDYHHPVLLLVLGIVVVVVSGYLGITSLSSLSALFA